MTSNIVGTELSVNVSLLNRGSQPHIICSFFNSMVQSVSVGLLFLLLTHLVYVTVISSIEYGDVDYSVAYP